MPINYPPIPVNLDSIMTDEEGNAMVDNEGNIMIAEEVENG